MIALRAEPLTRAAFAAFGDVLDTSGEPLRINAGFALRFNDRCAVTIGEGATNVSLFIAKRRELPLQINMMEYHPLGSQAFMPLQNAPWMVVVCTDPDDAGSYRAFAASGEQGVNYAPGTWHFPLITFGEGDRFLVVDRKGPGNNLVEHFLAPERCLILNH
jgi:ureidoglycolate lyase